MKYLQNAILKLSTNNEGGYSNHPKDPGGPTNHGITLATLRAWRGGVATTADDVKRLTLAEANAIYVAHYWRPIWGDQLPAGLDYALFDFTINSGASRAVKELQGLLSGVAIDGLMGPKTIAAIATHSVSELIKALCNARMRFLKKLKTWKSFGRGWTYRVTGVDPQHVFKARLGVVGDALAMVEQRKISFLPFPLDDLMPLAKGREVDVKILAPLGNKIQTAVIAATGGGTLATSLPNLLPQLTQAKDAIETVKDVSKIFTYIFAGLTVLCAIAAILHGAQKIREAGTDT